MVNKNMDTAEPGSVQFHLELERLKQPPAAAVVVFEFDNPEKGARPYVVERAFVGGESSIIAKSPAYFCLVNNRLYKVVAKLYTDLSKAVLLGTHEQLLQFALPAKHWAPLKLKECDA